MSRFTRRITCALPLGALVLLQACSGGRSGTKTTDQQETVSALSPWLQTQQNLQVQQLTFSSSDQLAPMGIPGSSDIVYQSNGDGNWELYRIHLASGTMTRITDSPENEEDPSFSPDGRRVLCTVAPATAMQAPPRDILLMSPEGKERRIVAQHGADDWFPRFSPDGEGIYFVSDRVDERLQIEDEERRSAIFFYSLRSDELRQITAGEDETAPLPMADGTLVYRAGDGALHLMDPSSGQDQRLLAADRGVYGRPVNLSHHWILPGRYEQLASVLFAADADFGEVMPYFAEAAVPQRTPCVFETANDLYLVWSEFHEGQWDLFYQIQYRQP